LCVAITCIAHGAALAQDATRDERSTAAASSAQLEPVVVVAMKDAARVSYARLLDGVATFNAKRNLAPGAVLYFVAHDQSTLTQPLQLKIETAEKAIPIDIDANGRFVLPIIDITKVEVGDIVSNRRAGQLEITARVVSPGTTESTRRFGDLRLECEVDWAIEKHNASLLIKAAVKLAGGLCTSASLSTVFGFPRKVLDAELSFGDRTAKFAPFSDGVSVRLPLYDTTWSDETRVVFHPDTQTQ